MKIIYRSLVVIILYFSVFNTLKAQRLYVFSVIDTKDFNRPDRNIDYDRIQETGKNIAKYLGLDYYSYNFGEEDAFSVSAVKNTVRNLKNISCESDVIWFHFSGYGRNDNQSTLPVLKLIDGEISASEIMGNLQEKRPKMLLFTIEAGNKIAEPKQLSNQIEDEVSASEGERLKRLKRSAIAPKETILEMKTMPSVNTINHYESLFKEFKGVKTVIMTSCDVGQTSNSNYTVGSEWLNQFSKTFEQLSKPEPIETSWEGISKKISTIIQSKFKGKQTPQSSIKNIAIKCNNSHDDDK
jgi:Caspase domain